MNVAIAKSRAMATDSGQRNGSGSEMTFMSVEKLFCQISKAALLVAGVALVMMMAHVSLDVSLKYLINKPIPATLEIVSNYYMVAIIFLPLGLLTRNKEHLEVELFTQWASRRYLAGIVAAASFVAACFCVIFAYKTFQEALDSTLVFEYVDSPTIDIHVWAARWLVPLGSFLMLVHFLLNMFDSIWIMLGKDPLIPNPGQDAEITNEYSQ